MDDKEAIAGASIAPVQKRKRSPAKRKPARPAGRKTLIAALAAALLALTDLFLTVRLGIKLF